MFALADRRDHFADILAVFGDRIADLKIRQRNLVADGHIVVTRQLEIGIIMGHDAGHVRAGFQIFDDNHADIVLVVMDQQVRDTQRNLQRNSDRRLGRSSLI